MPDAEVGRWVPLAEAGRALGLQPDTLRKQAKRGLRDARRDNHGRWLILVKPDEAGSVPDDATRHGPAARSDGPAPGRTEPDAELLARAAVAEALVAELRERLKALEDRLDEARLERRLLQEAHEAEVDRLLTVVEQLAALAERREPERRPWPGLRAWWRRFVEGRE